MASARIARLTTTDDFRPGMSDNQYAPSWRQFARAEATARAPAPGEMLMTSIATIAATRFGYGFHPDQIAPTDAEGLIAELDAAEPADLEIGGPVLTERAAFFQQYVEALNASRQDMSLVPRMRSLRNEIDQQFMRDVSARIGAPIFSRRGFFERLCWFWADHFSVSARGFIRKSLSPRLEPDAIRPHVGGRFGDMLKAAVMHPAMIAYLDQHHSFGPSSVAGLRRGRGLNENLAREIMELHTLGVGGAYQQADIRQLAELLTGVSIGRGWDGVTFKPQQAEPGAETVLGLVYGGDPPKLDDVTAVLDDLAVHPGTAGHIAQKLATHFISDTPGKGLVGHIEAAFKRTDGQLKAVYQAMLEHPDSWAPEARKVRQPFDYLVSALRAAGIARQTIGPFLEQTGPLSVVEALKQLNQPMMAPAGPDGWPEAAEEWINPQGLAARLRWAEQFARVVEQQLDPRAYLSRALRDRASPETIFAVTNAPEKWVGIALVLASPEFNRR